MFLTKKFDSSSLFSFLPTSFISLSTSSNVLGFKSIRTGFLSIKSPKHFSTSFKENNFVGVCAYSFEKEAIVTVS